MTSFENNNALAGNQQLTFIEGKLQFLPSSGLTCSKLEISNNRRGVHKVWTLSNERHQDLKITILFSLKTGLWCI